MLFIETSAKTAANCALVFESIAKKLTGYVEPEVPAGVDDSSTLPATAEDFNTPSENGKS